MTKYYKNTNSLIYRVVPGQHFAEFKSLNGREWKQSAFPGDQIPGRLNIEDNMFTEISPSREETSETDNSPLNVNGLETDLSESKS